MSTQILFNGDDFGRSAGINAGILRAHEEGVLTSASLMVTGASADEAVAIARSHPDLAVGLHVVAVNGRAASPPEQIPHLVSQSGQFPDDPVAAGVRYAFSAVTRAELARELRAQFERFAATGLPLAHVDSHVHIHMHPVVLGMIVPLAVEFGAHRIRIPRDDFGLDMRIDRSHVLKKVVWTATYAVLNRWALRRLRNVPLVVTGRVYGLLQTGNMHDRYVASVLRWLNVASAELYFHPAAAPPYDAEGPNQGDLTTLLNPVLPTILHERGLERTGIISF